MLPIMNCPIPSEEHLPPPPVSYPVEAVQSIRAVEAVLERDDEDGIRVITCHVYKRRQDINTK